MLGALTWARRQRSSNDCTHNRSHYSAGRCCRSTGGSLSADRWVGAGRILLSNLAEFLAVFVDPRSHRRAQDHDFFDGRTYLRLAIVARDRRATRERLPVQIHYDDGDACPDILSILLSFPRRFSELSRNLQDFSKKSAEIANTY